jgi:hypothetical protein
MPKPAVAALTAGALAVALLLSAGLPRTASSSETRAVPPPATDSAASAAKSEVAVLAGGCFWGVQGVFQHVKASPAPFPATRAVRRARPSTSAWAPAARATPSPCR